MSTIGQGWREDSGVLRHELLRPDGMTATASAGPVVVTATATPTTMNLSYEDGSPATRSVTCGGPGTPWSEALARRENPDQPLQAQSPDCGWVYRNSSAWVPNEFEPITATVTYHVTWTVVGAPGGGDLGTLNSPVTTDLVKVGEIQAIVQSR